MNSVLGVKTMRLAMPRVGNVCFWLATVFPLVLAIALVIALLSLTAANADEAAADACNGKNLMTGLKTSDPAKYASIVAAGDKVVNGKGTFWKIEKPGLKPSWLLGTMHVSDPRVLAMPKGAQEASAAADTIVIESDEVLDEKKALASLLTKPELMMLTDGSTLSQHLSPQDNARLEAALKQRGIPLAAVAHMQPWLISSSFEMTACEMLRKSKGAKFLDQKLASDAAAAGKQVKGLETLAEQAKAMSDLPLALHMKSLIQTLDLGDKINDVNETMTELYLAGDVGTITPMLEKATPSDGASDRDYAAFDQRIVLDRNQVMAERAAPILANGNVFIAVGALHLPGKRGLIELLRQQGFTVTAVN